jgi:hypothetical protein
MELTLDVASEICDEEEQELNDKERRFLGAGLSDHVWSLEEIAQLAN